MHGVIALLTSMQQPADVGFEGECFQDEFDSLIFDDARPYPTFPDSGSWSHREGRDNLAGRDLQAGRRRVAPDYAEECAKRASPSPVAAAAVERDIWGTGDGSCEQDPFDSLELQEDEAASHGTADYWLGACGPQPPPRSPAARRRRSLEVPASQEDFAVAVAARLCAARGGRRSRRRRPPAGPGRPRPWAQPARVLAAARALQPLHPLARRGPAESG